MKKKLQKLSLWSFLLALFFGVAAYFCFHYLTDAGFTTVWHPEAGKPFVTEMLGDMGVLFLFSSIMSQLAARILYSGKSGD